MPIGIAEVAASQLEVDSSLQLTKLLHGTDKPYSLHASARQCLRATFKVREVPEGRLKEESDLATIGFTYHRYINFTQAMFGQSTKKMDRISSITTALNALDLHLDQA